MAHEWHRGVLTASSWHGLEEIGVMADDNAMISHGEASGAWPVALRLEALRTAGGLVAPERGIVASYSQHPEACLSVVGGRFNATTPDGWRTLVKAAVAAGAKPTGAFALRDGSRVLATFEVGQGNGVRTQLVIADAFDGSMRLSCGFSSVRVVCANTLSVAMSSDGERMAKLRHTASLETKVNALAEGIADAVKKGDSVRDAYYQAERIQLSRAQASTIFDQLFPAAPEDADKAAKTRADNNRADAVKAMRNPVNNVGSTLATIWNAATYLVDREADGSSRKVRGGSPLDSLLFGNRGERIFQIQQTIEVVMKDGSLAQIPVDEALSRGVDPQSVGKSLLGDLLNRPLS